MMRTNERGPSWRLLLLRSGAVATALAAVALSGASCDSTGSPDTLIANVAYNFSGTYTATAGAPGDPIVFGNTAPVVTMFQVIQTGNRVQVNDNNRGRYYGSLDMGPAGEDVTPVAQFVLDGTSGVGVRVTMVGTFVFGDQLTMDGQWLEPDTGLTAPLRAFALATQPLTPSDGGADNNGNTTPPTP